MSLSYNILQNQKSEEVAVFKDFLRINSITFEEKLLCVECSEPADLVYNNQKYQLTIGDGQYIGEIFAAKKYAINDSRRIVGRTRPTNEYLNTVLGQTLIKKKTKASRDVILLIRIYTPGPYSDDELARACQSFAVENMPSIDLWQQVVCFFFRDKIIEL